MEKPLLIGLDWGTTSCRAYLIGARDVLARNTDGPGILRVEGGAFGPWFDTMVGEWIATHGVLPIILSGMIGSRQGWKEAPYAKCPAGVADIVKELAHIDHDGLAMRNFIGQIAREKLGKGSHTLGDAFDNPKLRCSGADRREEGGQHPVGHFAGRIVEERSQAECVYISGSRLGTWWGRGVHVRLLKIAWGGADAEAHEVVHNVQMVAAHGRLDRPLSSVLRQIC